MTVWGHVPALISMHRNVLCTVSVLVEVLPHEIACGDDRKPKLSARFDSKLLFNLSLFEPEFKGTIWDEAVSVPDHLKRLDIITHDGHT